MSRPALVDCSNAADDGDEDLTARPSIFATACSGATLGNLVFLNLHLRLGAVEGLVGRHFSNVDALRVWFTLLLTGALVGVWVSQRRQWRRLEAGIFVLPAVLALLALAALAGCNGTGNRGTAVPAIRAPSSPAPAPVPNPLAPQTYTIAIVGTSTVTAPAWDPSLPITQQVWGPLAVIVTDAAGNPVDGVNVAFRSSAMQPPSWGPFGLGDTLSGDGMWQVSAPGTGIAAVGFTPRVVGQVQVVATVVPVVSSAPTPPAKSNSVAWEVIGQ